MTILFNVKEHGIMIAKAIPRCFDIVNDIVISNVSADGKLLGGVTFDGFVGNCIFIHQAGFDKHWLSKDMLFCAFDYPFNRLGVGKVAATISSGATELLAFNARLGFIEECRIKDAYPDGDMVVLSMTREQCPWLKIKPSTFKKAAHE